MGLLDNIVPPRHIYTTTNHIFIELINKKGVSGLAAMWKWKLGGVSLIRRPGRIDITVIDLGVM